MELFSLKRCVSVHIYKKSQTGVTVPLMRHPIAYVSRGFLIWEGCIHWKISRRVGGFQLVVFEGKRSKGELEHEKNLREKDKRKHKKKIFVISV